MGLDRLRSLRKDPHTGTIPASDTDIPSR
jgi:hypothetical protein